jgi:hypothetical protein
VGAFVGTIAAVIAGAGLGVASVLGVVQLQSDAPQQPAESVIPYGTND